MRFDYSMVYYLGCVLLCIAIVVLIVFILCIRKLTNNQELLIQRIRDYEYPLNLMKEHLREIDNDIYAIKQKLLQR